MNVSKIKKGQQGFTLVEVIVVAIIVAALAAVAVPMYTSYVTSSRENAAANAAGSVASFMGACINQGGSVSSGAAEEGGGGEGEGEEGEGGSGAITHEGGENTELTCSAKGAAKIQLPTGIHIVISEAATSGMVTAYHLEYEDGIKKYNY